MMTQAGRGFLGALSRMWRTIVPGAAGRPRLVGTDLDGNHYYEAAAVEGRYSGRRRRFVTPGAGHDPEAHSTVVPSVPSEWEAWLRGRREGPPSDEEQLRNLAAMKMKQAKARELDAKAAEERAHLLEEGAIHSEADPSKAERQFPALPEFERFPGEAADMYEARAATAACLKKEAELRAKLEAEKAQTER